MKITSRDNSKLKNARKIRDGKIDDLIFVEGLRLCEELVNSDLKIAEAFYTDQFPSTTRSEELLDKLRSKNVDLFEITGNLAGSLSDTKSSQGIFLVAQRPHFELSDIRTHDLSGKSPIVLLLSKVNNPSNLGVILRTAEASGVSGVLITKHSANAFSPKSLRASMGSAFRLPVIENVDLSEAVAWAKKHKLETVCADINGKFPYTEYDWTIPTLLVFGSEAHGLTAEEIEVIERSITVPMNAPVESLNLATSAAVILFEARRQREIPKQNSGMI
ncbi:MAG: RNA methyltransferase [Pyrinomonadaceae bacterium]|nr:RNA methyltransferase [Pyrinomonadaceae bacterium]